MFYEAVCGRCGDTYQFESMGNTRHPRIYGNRVCNGLPVRIFEVYDSFTELQAAMIERAINKQQYPLIRFRPTGLHSTLESTPSTIIQLPPGATVAPITGYVTLPHQEKPKSRWQRWLDKH